MTNAPTARELGAVAEQHGRDIVTLREYEDEKISNLKSSVDDRFEASKEAVSAALAAAKEAVVKTENAAEKRFELLNELRSGVATKEQLEALEKVVSTLEKRTDLNEGRNIGVQTTVGQLVAGVAVFVAFASLIAYIAFNLGHK